MESYEPDAFYMRISSATVCNGWISFEHKIPSTALNDLYIRKSYQMIADQIILTGKNKTLITGTPGIGKSMFLLYLLWKLVTDSQKKRVLFVYNPDIIYYDGNEGIFSLKNVPPKNDLSFWNEELWCLLDAKEQGPNSLSNFRYGDCVFVLSMSPRREMTNDFKKPPVPTYFYMPLWNEIELQAIAHLFPHATKWYDRFVILGGIPRNVLEDTMKDPEYILEAACSMCSLDDCIKEVGLDSTVTDTSKVVHSLVHIASTPPFTESSVCFASDTAFNIIIRNKGNEAKHLMRYLLDSCEKIPRIASLCGVIFENYAIELLEKGGTFDYHQLVHGNVEQKPNEKKVVILKSTKTVVDTVEPGQTLNQLHVPAKKNFIALDAWIPGVGAFQVTVGKTHDIHIRAKEYLAKLGSNGNKLYWVLPPLHYHSFTKKNPKEIDQYALLIPYPDERFY
jgi:hypothetical protein